MSSNGSVTPSPPRTRGDARPTSRSALPPWAVVLHDDDVNEMGHVWEILCKVTSLGLPGAFVVMMQAHRAGESIVVRTHREHGELLTERLVEQGLCASMRKL